MRDERSAVKDQQSAERNGQQLHVGFCGEEHVLRVGDRLDFGRAAALCVDDNPFLHRRVGRFRAADGGWWIDNLGSAIALELCDLDSTSRLTLAPGRSALIPFDDSVLRFSAGPSNYELEVSTEAADEEPITQTDPEASEPATITPASLRFTPDQRRCIVALAEPRLLDPGAAAGELPSNRQASLRLGWKLTRFNRKLDNVCGKLTKAGVAGLHGGPGGLASRRRDVLVEFALTTQIITTADLELLPQTGVAVSR